MKIQNIIRNRLSNADLIQTGNTAAKRDWQLALPTRDSKHLDSPWQSMTLFNVTNLALKVPAKTLFHQSCQL